MVKIITGAHVLKNSSTDRDETCEKNMTFGHWPTTTMDNRKLEGVVGRVWTQ